MKNVMRYRKLIWVVLFLLLAIFSYYGGFEPGKMVYKNFLTYFVEMITFIPFLFIIVGLFDVWFPKEKVERHIGQDSGAKGIFLVILLAMLQAGPLYGAFPVAYMLYKKGASIKNIFVYLGAFSSLKIPMLGMEIGYLGIQFTLVRTAVSLPLFIAIGFLMEAYLKGRDFSVSDGK